MYRRCVSSLGVTEGEVVEDLPRGHAVLEGGDDFAFASALAAFEGAEVQAPLQRAAPSRRQAP